MELLFFSFQNICGWIKAILFSMFVTVIEKRLFSRKDKICIETYICEFMTFIIKNIRRISKLKVFLHLKER